MLPRSKRLRRESDIMAVFRKGWRRRGALMTVHGRQSEAFRATVVVGKKVSKKAVERNRLKRKIRTIIQYNEPGASIDIVVVPNQKALSAEYHILEEEFVRLLQQSAQRGNPRRNAQQYRHNRKTDH